MTEKQLQQLPWMIKERDYQNQKMRELNDLSRQNQKGRGIRNFFGCSLNRREQEALSGGNELLERAEGMIRWTLEQRLEQVEEMYRFIYQVEDSQMRLILLARFVEGKSWQGVATAIGESDESYVRKKCQRFLKAYSVKEERHVNVN